MPAEIRLPEETYGEWEAAEDVCPWEAAALFTAHAVFLAAAWLGSIAWRRR